MIRETANKYGRLFDRSLSNAISVDEFQTIYLDAFKSEEHLDEPLFELLDEVFGDVESYANDPQWLSRNPDFHLDDAGLRRKIERAASRLSEMGSNGTSVQ